MRPYHFAFIMAVTMSLLPVTRAKADGPVDPLDVHVGETPDSEGNIPARQFSLERGDFQALPVDQQWQILERLDRVIVIAIKGESQPRAIWRGHNLTSAQDLQTGTNIVLELSGVVDVDQDGGPHDLSAMRGDPLNYPVIAVQLASRDALENVLELSGGIIDFYEPLLYMMNGAGCSAATDPDYLYQDPAVPAIVNSNTGPIPGGGNGDLIPWSYARLGIDRAWNLSQGQGVKIGVLDTGTSADQEQFWSFFAFGGRSSASHFSQIPGFVVDDVCGHGTKIAGITSAPRDGRNTVGVAWRADLVTERIGNGVVQGFYPTGAAGWDDTCQGLVHAKNAGARVINMAFGANPVQGWVGMSTLFTQCLHWAYNDPPEAILVAAAGTNEPAVVYPANQDSFVTAATLVELEELQNPQSDYKRMAFLGTVAYGASVDFASVIGNNVASGAIPTPGYFGDGLNEEISHIGGSSSATAHLSGIIALAWSNAPNLNRAQLLSRLQDGARRNRIDSEDLTLERSPYVGYGIPNAHHAAGGFSNVGISGPTAANPGAQVTLWASHDGEGSPSVFSYAWAKASAPTQIVSTLPYVQFLGGSTGGSETYRVTVCDTRDGTCATSPDVTVAFLPTDTQILYSSTVIQRGPGLLGARYDLSVNRNPDTTGYKMPTWCSIKSISAQEVHYTGVEFAPIGAPSNPYSGFGYGWTVSRPGGLQPNDLKVRAHVWHDAWGAAKFRVVYEVEKPIGWDCQTPGLVQPSPYGP